VPTRHRRGGPQFGGRGVASVTRSRRGASCAAPRRGAGESAAAGWGGGRRPSRSRSPGRCSRRWWWCCHWSWSSPRGPAEGRGGRRRGTARGHRRRDAQRRGGVVRLRKRVGVKDVRGAKVYLFMSPAGTGEESVPTKTRRPSVFTPTLTPPEELRRNRMAFGSRADAFGGGATVRGDSDSRRHQRGDGGPGGGAPPAGPRGRAWRRSGGAVNAAAKLRRHNTGGDEGRWAGGVPSHGRGHSDAARDSFGCGGHPTREQSGSAAGTAPGTGGTLKGALLHLGRLGLRQAAAASPLTPLSPHCWGSGGVQKESLF